MLPMQSQSWTIHVSYKKNIITQCCEYLITTNSMLGC